MQDVSLWKRLATLSTEIGYYRCDLMRMFIWLLLAVQKLLPVGMALQAISFEPLLCFILLTGAPGCKVADNLLS